MNPEEMTQKIVFFLKTLAKQRKDNASSDANKTAGAGQESKNESASSA